MWKRDKPGDAHLVAQVLGGKPDAFGVLVERYLGLAYAVAYACSLSREDTEDIVQESFLKAFRSLHGLREPARFASWLTRIVHNTGCSLIESRRLDRMVRAAVEPPASELSSPFRDEMHELLKRRMQDLTPQEREVLTLHYYAGKTAREVAALLGISRDAAKKRIERARNTLGAALIAELMPAVESEDSSRETRVRSIVALCLAEPVTRPLAPVIPMSLPFGIKGVSLAAAVVLVAFSVPIAAYLARGETSGAPATVAAATVSPSRPVPSVADIQNIQDPHEILAIYKAQQDKLQRFTVSWYMEKDLVTSRGNLRIYENGQLSQDSPKKRNVLHRQQWGNMLYDHAPVAYVPGKVSIHKYESGEHLRCELCPGKKPYGVLGRGPQGLVDFQQTPMLLLTSYMPGHGAMGYNNDSLRVDQKLANVQLTLRPGVEQMGSSWCRVIEGDTRYGYITAYFDVERECALAALLIEMGPDSLAIGGRTIAQGYKVPGARVCVENTVEAFTMVDGIWLPVVTRLRYRAVFPDRPSTDVQQVTNFQGWVVNPDFGAVNPFDLRGEIPDNTKIMIPPGQAEFLWDGGRLTPLPPR